MTERQQPPEQQPVPRRRRPRRAAAPATNPAAENGADLVDPSDGDDDPDAPHDRWLREQRPPHWE